MPDTRSHRGPDPRDDEAFGPVTWPALRAAVADLSWLLGGGYALPSALKIVGDRWSLTERQRMAVRRCACADDARDGRLARQVAPDEVRGKVLLVDGFNILTTIEGALGGAVVLLGRDGAARDLAGMHGTYRKVEETRPAVALLGRVLAALGVAETRWLLDRPVSNSGRLRTVLLDSAEETGAHWTVELVFDPDPLLAASSELVVTADSAILDRGPRWLNLARLAIESTLPDTRLVDLS